MAGKIFIVGLGPGAEEYLTPQASAAMEQADLLCGYTVYIDLVKARYPGKETYTTPMTRELERCQLAVDRAAEGHTVAMLCSGDAGVYGMAGPVLQLAGDRSDVEVEVIPGITAALSGAALLGAPLMHDFCVISLSDLLTPWPLIEKRLEAAAVGDFAVAIYNPMSHKRPDHLKKACDILLRHRAPENICGWVQNIGRPGETAQVLTLAELRESKLDMFTTVFIGNSATRNIGGKMVTPRGYEKKL